jgi:hypothetical protein
VGGADFAHRLILTLAVLNRSVYVGATFRCPVPSSREEVTTGSDTSRPAVAAGDVCCFTSLQRYSVLGLYAVVLCNTQTGVIWFVWLLHNLIYIRLKSVITTLVCTTPRI